jgi:hypothetical protein
MDEGWEFYTILYLMGYFIIFMAFILFLVGIGRTIYEA